MSVAALPPSWVRAVPSPLAWWWGLMCFNRAMVADPFEEGSWLGRAESMAELSRALLYRQPEAMARPANTNDPPETLPPAYLP